MTVHIAVTKNTVLKERKIRICGGIAWMIRNCILN